MSAPLFKVPVTVEVEVWVTDGSKVATLTVGLPAGKMPTDEMIMKAIEGAAEIAGKQGLRLCTPHEFGQSYVRLKSGENLSIPGPDKWDDEKLNLLSRGDGGALVN